jgi:4a-hydroxytetrahydrobiopterin dehydratase
VPRSGEIKLLTGPALADALMELSGWELKGKQIVKSYDFKTFADALEFVNEVAKAALQAEHHPEIHVVGGKARLAFWTSKLGGVSTLDVRLAAAADKVFESA